MPVLLVRSLANPRPCQLAVMSCTLSASISYSLQKSVRRWCAIPAKGGRHPPLRFDMWLAYAQSQGTVMVEQPFDRIEHDAGPVRVLDDTEIATGPAGELGNCAW